MKNLDFKIRERFQRREQDEDRQNEREQPSFEVRAESFKKRTKEFFSTYENPNGSEDRLEICLIREGYRAVLTAEEKINRQKANAEGLTNAVKFLNEKLLSAKGEAVKEFAEELIYKIVNTPTKFESTFYMYREGIAFRQNEIIDIIKETAGDGTRRCTEELTDCRAKTTKRPPQSWCYVEDMQVVK